MARRLKSLVLGLLPTAVAGRLRIWRLNRAVRRFRPEVVEHDYGGGRLRVELPDALAKGWYDSDWPELPEVAALGSAGCGRARGCSTSAHIKGWSR